MADVGAEVELELELDVEDEGALGLGGEGVDGSSVLGYRVGVRVKGRSWGVVHGCDCLSDQGTVKGTRIPKRSNQKEDQQPLPLSLSFPLSTP